jgi:hypothetical protein
MWRAMQLSLSIPDMLQRVDGLEKRSREEAGKGEERTGSVGDGSVDADDSRAGLGRSNRRGGGTAASTSSTRRSTSSTRVSCSVV